MLKDMADHGKQPPDDPLDIFPSSAVMNGPVPKQKAKHQLLLPIMLPIHPVHPPLLEQMLLVALAPAKLFVGTVVQQGTLLIMSSTS